MFRSFLTGLVVLFAVGCATGEDVADGQSAVAAAGAAGAGALDSTGGSGSGGSAALGAAGAPDYGTGGSASSSTGGSAGSDEETGGTAGNVKCASGEKLCESGCVAVTPEVGCGSAGCSPCNTPPANSKATCAEAFCEFECLPGFTRQGFACVSTQGSGGSGGSGGTPSAGGAPGAGGNGASGGSGGSGQLCGPACNPSDPTSQFLCAAACVAKGGFGICAPALNCCVCG